MIVFKHNYGGKTLVSLLATAAEGTRAPFAPLYQDIAYIDPFAEDAAEQFRAEIAGGQVGLVWIELVHGSSDAYAPIPDDLLGVVASERTENGFLVGVDEILTSYYRCGRRFAHVGRLPEIDLMTLSKALSYGCFPTGAALVSDAVRAAAADTDARLVDELHTCHINQLGAHFAVHAVAQVDALGLAERSEALSRIVQDGIAALNPDSATVGKRFAEGLLGRLEVRPPPLTRRLLKAQGDSLGHLLILWWIVRARVFIVYDVFLLPLTASQQEIRQVMRQADRLSRTGPYALIAQVALSLAGERIRAALRRPRAALKNTAILRRFS
jgi:acetylornithine/succinyldiaminopimelate/putrescine aminotransferase